jgi:hypothetical protein
MTTFLESLETHGWNDKPIAVLRLNIGDLLDRAHLTAHRGYDDLDTLRWVLLYGSSGRAFALLQHDHAPEPGTQVLTAIDSPNARADLNEVLSALQLDLGDIAWEHPSIGQVGHISIANDSVSVFAAPHSVVVAVAARDTDRRSRVRAHSEHLGIWDAKKPPLLQLRARAAH